MDFKVQLKLPHYQNIGLVLSIRIGLRIFWCNYGYRFVSEGAAGAVVVESGLFSTSGFWKSLPSQYLASIYGDSQVILW
jgi:hypothetical protein